jgi:hypothetical protein
VTRVGEEMAVLSAGSAAHLGQDGPGATCFPGRAVRTRPARLAVRLRRPAGGPRRRRCPWDRP